MNLRFSISILLIFLAYNFSFSAEEIKIPRVPSEIMVAGMKLKITEAARREMQEEVNKLRNAPKYFNIKADRARLYFPIIEKIFKEEGIPDDFKFLAIQESALISDAVSSANAVGFWQFKDFTGREVGLKIDVNVDERLNIVSSTYGVSKYFRRNNFYFKNWIYTILAHMTGRGGAMKHVDKSQFGVKKMTINKNSHWYVKRFIVHVIAYRDAVKGAHSEGLNLLTYEKGEGKSLESIAKDFKVDYQTLRKYNKWLKRGKVPGEKRYTVLIPTTKKVKSSTVKNTTPKEEKPIVVVENTYPNIEGRLNSTNTIFIKINGLQSILAKRSDTADSLAAKGNISISKFLKYNDITLKKGIVEGEIYYLKKKRKRAHIYFYTVTKPESMWSISQKFGLRLKNLAKLNRMLIIDNPEIGRVMWLREKRPKNTPIEIKEIENEIILIDKEPQPIIKEVLPVESDKVDKVIVEEESVKVELKPDTKEGDVISVPIQKVEEKPANSKMSNNKRHIVKSGDTLYGISVKYSVSVDDLRKWNQLKSTALNLGQHLIINKTTKQNDKIVKPPVNTIKSNSIENDIIHIVKSGESLYNISKKYGVSIDELFKLNNLQSPDLNIGQQLKIDAKATLIKKEKNQEKEKIEVEKSTHIVVSGESLYNISKQYNVEVSDIMKWNKLSSPNLKIGQKLTLEGEINTPKNEKPEIKEAKPVNVIFHVVESGDTLYGISRKYNIDIKKLLALNNKNNVSLNVGEKVRIRE